MITGYKWELYNVKEDPTEFNDLAAKMPEKLKEMQALFYSGGEEVQRAAARQLVAARWNTPRPSLTAGRTVFTYSGELTGVPASAAPSILNKSYTITAEVEIPEGGAEGMIVTEGGRFGGYGLFLSKGECLAFGRGKPVFLYNLLDLKRTIVGRAGAEAWQAHHRLRLQVRRSGPGQGGHGRALRGRQGSGQEFHGAHHADHASRRTKPSTSARTPALAVAHARVSLRSLRSSSPARYNKLTFKLEPEVEARRESKGRTGTYGSCRSRIPSKNRSPKKTDTNAGKR